MFLLVVTVFLLNGCFVTKVVTVPLRVSGAIISVVPICGGPIDGVIDGTADLVD
ncbi:MAG: DUF6726 family protein [Pseudomonadota bacterium]|nr:DUF6726 family protein [Pseudomonadota bacterium]